MAMTNSPLNHEYVSDQQIRELHAANSHLMHHCDVKDTFIAHPVSYDEINGFKVTKLQIIEYFIGGTSTPRALIYRVTLSDGSEPTDTIRQLRVGDTIYHLLMS
jgi:hypothetical protein